LTIRHAIRLLPFAGASALSLIAGAALAQDDGLYPAPTAPDAAFLRVYTPGEEAIAVGDQTLQAGEIGFTPYLEVAPGPITVSIDGEEMTVEAKANTHYSYIVTAEGGEFLTDGVTGSPAQADLVFYNLSDIAAVDVFVPSANAVAIEGVAPQATSAVALRAPLTLDLQLRNGEEAVADVAAVELVRSAGTTVVLTGEPGAYEAQAELNTYAE
jgi:alginate O-acetyltransferase complex protein AlgF